MKRKAAAVSHGHLMVIGGGEDRRHDMTILSRFVELAGGTVARIAVLTAASSIQDEMWEIYDRAFKELGVGEHFPVAINTREEANDESTAARMAESTGIFMTGGDQKRLLALIGGTAIDQAMHRAYLENGACIAGTSAGASAMSGHMLSESSQDVMAEKGTVHLGAGLGFLLRVVIDQHFSERRRLGRLLAVIAQNPYLFGVGIDENTALVLHRGMSLEVIGDGAVTLIDGRRMSSNFSEIGTSEKLRLINVKLHLLPAGSLLQADAGPADHADSTADALREIVSVFTSKEPLS